MSLQTRLPNTTCSKGHVHPPWPTTGVLRISKCESVCGFCQKETKTAANLRKHVAIHIKNERLDLSIAEGSSGRGRLEMPTPTRQSSSHSPSSDQISEPYPPDQTSHKRHLPQTSSTDFSPSQVLMSISKRSHPSSPSSAAHSQALSHSNNHQINTPSPRWNYSQAHPISQMPTPYSHPSSSAYIPSTSLSPIPSSIYGAGNSSTAITGYTALQHPNPDPYKALRAHNLSTKLAWAAIPATEGFRILDLCKSNSSISTHPDTSITPGEGTVLPLKVPCYNRETIYDEEWQTHMKDVHGVFLLWPETWMRRIEVLDLDGFGGDIGACNEVIMES